MKYPTGTIFRRDVNLPKTTRKVEWKVLDDFSDDGCYTEEFKKTLYSLEYNDNTENPRMIIVSMSFVNRWVQSEGITIILPDILPEELFTL